MPRKLILCFDGTNHQYAATNTNVVKLYSMLDRNDEEQLAYYQPGIGTRLPAGVWGRVRRWVLRKLDLSIAFLLKDHVCNGYRFLMRHYRPGDEIFIFGFSRGAYTARVLAAMLYKVGLLTKGNEELIPFAWRMYRHERNYRTSFSFRRTFSRQVRVRFLGLWDTVSSIGWAWDPQHLQYTRQNRIVDAVRHAVALDERVPILCRICGAKSRQKPRVRMCCRCGFPVCIATWAAATGRPKPACPRSHSSGW